MPTLTPTTSAVFIPEEWAKEAEIARDNELVVAPLVERKYESDLTVGDTVHIPFVANMTADTIVPGIDLTAAAPTETEIALLVDTMIGKAVTVHDWTKKQSKYDLAAIYGKQIGGAIGRKIDSDTWNELVTGSQGAGGNTALNLGTTPTYTQIVAAVVALDKKNVPMEDRNFVVDAILMGDLRQMAEFTRYDAVGQKNPSTATDAKQSLVGWIYGIPVHMSNNAPIITGTPNQTANILFQKTAVALVIQMEMEMERDRRALASSTDVVGRALYGKKTLRPDHAIVLKRT